MSRQNVLVSPSSVKYVKGRSLQEGGGVKMVVKGIEVVTKDAESDADTMAMDEEAMVVSFLRHAPKLRWKSTVRAT